MNFLYWQWRSSQFQEASSAYQSKLVVPKYRCKFWEAGHLKTCSGWRSRLATQISWGLLWTDCQEPSSVRIAPYQGKVVWGPPSKPDSFDSTWTLLCVHHRAHWWSLTRPGQLDRVAALKRSRRTFDQEKCGILTSSVFSKLFGRISSDSLSVEKSDEVDPQVRQIQKVSCSSRGYQGQTYQWPEVWYQIVKASWPQGPWSGLPFSWIRGMLLLRWTW